MTLPDPTPLLARGFGLAVALLVLHRGAEAVRGRPVTIRLIYGTWRAGLYGRAARAWGLACLGVGAAVLGLVVRSD